MPTDHQPFQSIYASEQLNDFIMKGLVLSPATREVTLRDDLLQPIPAAGEILIHVQAVALNPVDELYVSQPIAEQEQRIIGTDFAGIVVGAGSDLADSPDVRAKIGARVSGFLQGGEFASLPTSVIVKLTCTALSLLHE